jgi:hypothetical protein
MLLKAPPQALALLMYFDACASPEYIAVSASAPPRRMAALDMVPAALWPTLAILKYGSNMA